MPTIKDAVIKKHETFRFVTYNFSNLKINIKKNELIVFLKKLYKELTGTEISEEKKEIKDIKGSEIQYVLFYGDFGSRTGFEYIYSSKEGTPETTASYYMFQETIKENFYLYFNLSDRKETLKPKRQEHEIEEIVVYMAQFFDKSESDYEQLFNNALKILDNFIQNHSL